MARSSLSETTRALLGNELPERVSVRDLGQQHLKDVQYEHVYELSLDEAHASFPPLKATGESREESIEKRFEERINRYVEDQLEAALSNGPPPLPPATRSAGSSRSSCWSPRSSRSSS